MLAFLAQQIDSILIYIIAVASLNLMIGYLGILHFGQIGLYLMGAYVSAILAAHGIPFIVSVPLAMVVGTILGYIIGLPCLRMKGHYLALGTLGLSEVIRLTALNWVSVTDGPLGMRAIPRPYLFGLHFDTKIAMMPLYFVITALVLWVIYRITHSPYGKIMETIREDEIGSESLGKDVTRYKLQIFAVSAAFAALSGALFAHFNTYIDPSLGKIPDMVLLIVMLVVGGAGTFWGGVFGPIFITALFESIRLLPIPGQFVGTVQHMLYSLGFILLIIFRPQGIFGRIKFTHYKKR